MSAFRARICLGVFLAVFVCVAVNAMVLQGDGLNWRRVALMQDTNDAPRKRRTAVRHELPRWSAMLANSAVARDGIAGGTAITPVNTPDMAATAMPDGARFRAGKRETVRAIQRELTERGYEPGPVDGVTGVMTRAAIMAYEHDERLPVAGVPSVDLLQRVVLGQGVQTGRTNGVAVTPVARRIARGVQETLSRLGYAPGPADGVISNSSNSARAIRAFERDHNMTETGRVSGRLIGELGRANGSRFSVAAGW